MTKPQQIGSAGDDMVQREKNVATRDVETEVDGQANEAPVKRHGGALPN
jgi:hypothetical protein